MLCLGDSVVRWIEEHISGRISGVHVGEELLGSIPMRSCAPQGSAIGPFLFLLFVNDLPDAVEALTLLFADDIKMVTRRTQNMNLHSSITAAWDWSKKWDIPINPAKYNYFGMIYITKIAQNL